MNWIKYNWPDDLKQGTICRAKNGTVVIVGEINTMLGLNDEFTADITHYTEDKIPLIEQLLLEAENDFNEK